MVETATTFSAVEVKKFLTEDGYMPATAAFREEMDRRYAPTDDQQFVERDDWAGDRKKLSETS